MASNISEDAADDLLYFARAGEVAEMKTLLDSLAEAHQCSRTDILVHVKDQGKSSCLHMASANGHNGKSHLLLDHSRRTDD